MATLAEMQQATGGTPEKTKKFFRKTFRAVTCGDLAFKFEGTGYELDGKLDELTPRLYATARGYNNKDGYSKEIILSDDVEDLRALIKAIEDVIQFREDSGLSLCRDTNRSDMSAAYAAFKVNPKK